MNSAVKKHRLQNDQARVFIWAEFNERILTLLTRKTIRCTGIFSQTKICRSASHKSRKGARQFFFLGSNSFLTNLTHIRNFSDFFINFEKEKQKK